MIGTLIARLAVKKTFAALNQKNLQQFLKDWHQEAVFHYPGSLSVSGTSTGKPEIRDWFQNMFHQFTQIQFTPKHICVENLFDMVGSNTLLVQVDIRLVNKQGVAVENSATILIRLHFGKVVEARDYFFYPERLATGWAEA